MLSVSVSRGKIFNPTFFLTNSIAPKSSVSSIATSSVSGFFLNAIILCLRAIGSGMSESMSRLIFCPLSPMNGIPRIYASVRRRSSSASFPSATKILPRYALLLFAFFSASRVDEKLFELFVVNDHEGVRVRIWNVENVF